MLFYNRICINKDNKIRSLYIMYPFIEMNRKKCGVNVNQDSFRSVKRIDFSVACYQNPYDDGTIQKSWF